MCYTRVVLEENVSHQRGSGSTLGISDNHVTQPDAKNSTDLHITYQKHIL